MLSDERVNSLIEFCRELIRNQSTTGEEGKVVNILRRKLIENDFDDVFIDIYGNIIGHIKGRKPGKKLLIHCGLDTWPIEDDSQWSYPPFGAIIKEGRIYGRGASEVKGQTSSIIAALTYFLDDYKRKFNGDIYFVGIVNDKTLQGLSINNIINEIKPNYVIKGDPTELQLKNNEKGYAEINIEVFGNNENAVYKMMKIIDAINSYNKLLELVDIRSAFISGHKEKPNYCKAIFKRCISFGETKESVLNEIKDEVSIIKEKESISNVEVSYCWSSEISYTGEIINGEKFINSWLINNEDEYYQLACKGLSEVGIESLNNKSIEYDYHELNNLNLDIKTISFGPGKKMNNNDVDEYIEINKLCKGAEGYYGILKSVFEK